MARWGLLAILLALLGTAYAVQRGSQRDAAGQIRKICSSGDQVHEAALKRARASGLLIAIDGRKAQVDDRIWQRTLRDDKIRLAIAGFCWTDDRSYFPIKSAFSGDTLASMTDGFYFD